VLQKEKPALALIFTRTKMGADRLNEILNDRGFKSMCLHGDMSQGKRDRTMEAFRSGQLNVLVATDLAARGIDVMDISHVLNYDLPEDPLTYVHRVGRTGRMQNKGRAISLIFSDQFNLISMCEKAAQHKIVKMEFEIPPLPPRPHGPGAFREGGSSRFGGERRSFGGSRFGGERRSFGSREGGHSAGYQGSHPREGGSGYQGSRPREGGAPHSGSREGGSGYQGSHPREGGSREGGHSSYGRREGGYGSRGGSSYGRREGGHGGSREGGRFGGDRDRRSKERSTRGGSSYFGRRG